MTSVGRAYVATGTLLVFLVLWAAIAGSPWASDTPDPTLAALARREAIVRRHAALAEQRYAQRWASYRTALAARGEAPRAAPAPQVRIVQLPAATTTRSS